MRPFPKLRPTGWDALAALLIAALALGAAVLQWRGGETGGLMAVVSVDGTETDRFDPKELLDGPRTYEGSGYTLELACGFRGEPSRPDQKASSGEFGLWVARSDCPTQDCVHTGVITRSGQSIVCLPARIVIRLEGGAADPEGVDAALG